MVGFPSPEMASWGYMTWQHSVKVLAGGVSDIFLGHSKFCDHDPRKSAPVSTGSMSPWLWAGTSAPCSPPACLAARRLGVRAGGGEPVSAALHEPPGRPHQALAPAAAVAVLPLSAARCLYHHVPLLLPGTVPAACSSCMVPGFFLLLFHFPNVSLGRPGIWEEHT